MIAIEALTNAAIGLLVSWAATFFVLGYSVGGSAAVTVMFFCLSFIRGYFVRLVFSRLTVPGDYATRGHGNANWSEEDVDARKRQKRSR